MNQNRRTFMFVASAAGLSAVGVNAAYAQKAPAALPMLDEADPTAKALGYVANAAKVDKVKYKQFAAGQKCTSCTLFVGKATDKAGGCPLFQGKQVAGEGWCISWAKKAKA
ncbi:MAG: iron permease [Gammaproteobacteria bacterium]|nr:iron permease [Gammaproteobacteria bacterium]